MFNYTSINPGYCLNAKHKSSKCMLKCLLFSTGLCAHFKNKTDTSIVLHSYENYDYFHFTAYASINIAILYSFIKFNYSFVQCIHTINFICICIHFNLKMTFIANDNFAIIAKCLCNYLGRPTETVLINKIYCFSKLINKVLRINQFHNLFGGEFGKEIFLL